MATAAETTAAPTPSPAPTAAALALGDDALMLSHRLGEWAGPRPGPGGGGRPRQHRPGLLGQARLLLSMAGDEDDLAYLREERAFRNLQLVKQESGDLAHTILWPQVTAPLAAKAVKEVAHHRDHAERTKGTASCGSSA
ncbi:Phenylacetic acid catabolic protein [Streptomyces sp. NPDC088921]|uniref:Phenylacetic acid catabolic protein n=1 Tax=unclassified Streptomyces TaxID=2593676 RepID=UPI00342A07F6